MLESVRKGRRALLAFAAAAVLAAGLVCLAGCGDSSSGSAGGGSSEVAGSSGSAVDTSAFESLDSVKLILGNAASPESSGDLWSKSFAEHIGDITGGKMTVDYFGNGELGGDADLCRQEQSNDIQIFVSQPAPMVSFVPELATFDLPMVFATYDADAIETALNGDNEFTQKLQEAYEKAKLHNLGWLQDGTFRQVTSNKELKTLADFKGFQIRTMENANHMAFWTAIGAEPTPLAFAEVYFALQNGTIQGQENPTDTSVGANLHEVQKYLCRTNHILSQYNMSISKECWDGLDPAYQAAIEQAVQEATDEIRPKLSSLDSDNQKKMEDAGMEVIEYDDAFFSEILSKEKVQDLYQDISKQTDGLSDLMIEQLEAAKA